MKHLLLLVVMATVTLSSVAQSDRSWTVDYSKSKSFIENKGQFDANSNEHTGPIQYAVDFGFSRIFFGEKGVSYSFLQVKKKSKEERTQIMASGAQSFEDHKQKEELFGKYLVRKDEVNMQWDGASSQVELVGLNKTSDYHGYSYTDSDGQSAHVDHVSAYTKIRYSNIYPHIDIEYEVHPEIGIKYAFILHPGANPDDIRMLFDRDAQLQDGEIHISTLFGDIKDHAPITFYEDDHQTIIESNFSYRGQAIAINLGNYDASKTVVIDPWVQTPNDPNSDWDVVWELDKDGAGNVYVIAGIMPMQLLKYNSTGTLQWTHNTPYDTTAWLGTMGTDNVGNTYVTNGTDYMIQKIDATGSVVWNNPNPSGGQISTEFWNISFNCDQSKLLIGGTGGNLDIHGRVYDIDMNSGNINSSVQVTSPGDLFSIPPNLQEVRAMCPAPNGKYYFVTLDTIGFLSDNLTLCPGGSSSLFLDDHGIGWGYKSENWRYNNTGIKAIRADDSFVYINKGNQVQRRSLVDGSVIASAAIPNGALQNVFLGGNQSHNAGTDVDDCGNIYVGSTDGVHKFDPALNLIASYPTTFTVYDVRVSTSGDIIACGGTGTSSSNTRSGGVQSFAAIACAQIAYTCCDATICIPLDVCEQDAPINLTTATGGGTWSGGPYIDAAGNFDPTIAGSGVFNVTYTLPCGSETIAITVNPCATLTICEEANGDLTASGGNGSYTWSTGTVNAPTSINSEQECIDCASATPQYTGFPPFQFYTGCDIATCPGDTTWTQYATGITTAAPGSYPIQIIDGNGTTTIINNAGELVACSANPCAGVTILGNVDAQTDPLCNGGTDGSATVSASGGASPYSYLWTPGSLVGPSQTGLAEGSYLVAISDDNGCTGDVVVNIGEPTVLFADIVSITDASCGASDGSATASATGGTGSYSYAWTPSGGSNAAATGLAPNSYTVTVTDQNGCTDDTTIQISTVNGPTINLDNSSNVTCFGGADGSATVSSTGGTPNYTYSWMPGSLTGTSQNALAAGSYTVTVSDASGCTDVVVIDITESTELIIDTVSVSPANCGASDGGANVIASGGTGTYTYAWSPVGGTGTTATNIPGGAYTVTVTDQVGCTATVNFSITTLGGPTVSVQNSTDVTCFGGADGSAAVDAVGGTPPFSYAWSPSGGTAASATGLSAGNYTVTVTDDAGCISAVTVTIGEPSEMLLSATISDENCGAADGAISTTVSGGSSPYTYLWSPNGETTASISGISGGIYDVSVTDAVGCIVSDSYTVNTVGSIPVDATPELTTISAGESVQLNATGADSYVWTPATGLDCSTCSNPIASPSITTSYIVVGTDAFGCTGSDTITIIVQQNCGDIYVPNIFSPNGAGPAANETLCVYGNCISTLRYSVFNRWGELVFETETTDLCWDGMHKNKPAISGVYAYKLFVTLSNGDVIEESGNVTLVR